MTESNTPTGSGQPGAEQTNPGQMNQGEAGQGGSQQEGSTQQLRDAAGQIGENIRHFGEQARGAAQETYDRYRQQAGDYYEQARGRATELQGDLEQYVREQPVKSIMIAAGVGLVLGMLLKRR